MRLRLITVAFDPDRGAFPEDPLAGIDGEIVTAVEHFFEHDGLPHLLLVVHHRQPEPDVSRGRGARRDDPAAELDPAGRALFDRLRAWRNARAEADGVPAYVVLTNRQLASLAATRPGTATALKAIDGIGEGRVARYGNDLLAALRSDSAPQPGPEASADAPDGPDA